MIPVIEKVLLYIYIFSGIVNFLYLIKNVDRKDDITIDDIVSVLFICFVPVVSSLVAFMALNDVVIDWCQHFGYHWINMWLRFRKSKVWDIVVIKGKKD